MIVDFNTLPNDSRLWIYQSNREFTPIELEEIEALTKTFLKNWQAHNKELEVSYQIKYNRFLILAVNESLVWLPMLSIPVKRLFHCAAVMVVAFADTVAM